MQRHDFTLAYVEKAFDFISENILTALVLLPFLYVILFADLGGFVSESSSYLYFPGHHSCHLPGRGDFWDRLGDYRRTSKTKSEQTL